MRWLLSFVQHELPLGCVPPGGKQRLGGAIDPDARAGPHLWAVPCGSRQPRCRGQRALHAIRPKVACEHTCSTHPAAVLPSTGALLCRSLNWLTAPPCPRARGPPTPTHPPPPTPTPTHPNTPPTHPTTPTLAQHHQPGAGQQVVPRAALLRGALHLRHAAAGGPSRKGGGKAGVQALGGMRPVGTAAHHRAATKPPVRSPIGSRAI